MKDSIDSPRHDHWLAHLLSTEAALQGGVLRCASQDVDRFVGRAAFLSDMTRRGFPVVENAGQFVIFCNSEPIRRLV